MDGRCHLTERYEISRQQGSHFLAAGHPVFNSVRKGEKSAETSFTLRMRCPDVTLFADYSHH